MLTAAPVTMPRVRSAPKQLPNWATALRNRRLQLGYSQEGVMAASKDGISQKAVSDLENARVQLTDMSLGRVVALARALNWSLAELQVATGVDLGLSNVEPVRTTTPTPVYLLQDLIHPNPKPHGMNHTPSEGPHPKNWRQTVMEGDEMMDAIREGESLYFDTDMTEPGPGAFIIAHAGRVHVRRYSVLPSGPAWITANPAYAHQFIPASNDVRVIGRIYRVVGIREDTALFN